MTDVPEGFTAVESTIPEGFTAVNNAIPEGFSPVESSVPEDFTKVEEQSNFVPNANASINQESVINNVPEGFKKVEPEIFGQPLSELEKVDNSAIKNILTEPVKDIKKLFTDGQSPTNQELLELSNSLGIDQKLYYHEKDGERYSTLVPVTENGMIDIPQMYKNAGSVKEFTKDLATWTGLNLFDKAWWIGETALDVTFAPIVGAIAIGGQTAEEVIKETLGEEGFEELQKNIFNSNTIKADDIKEHIEEVSHIILANTIAKGHTPSAKTVFKNESKYVDRQIIKENLVNEIKNTKPKSKSELETNAIDYNGERISFLQSGDILFVYKKNKDGAWIPESSQNSKILYDQIFNQNKNENTRIIDEVVKEQQKDKTAISVEDVNTIRNDLINKEIIEKTEPYIQDTKLKITDYIIDELISPNKPLSLKETLDLKQNLNNRISEKITKSEQPNYVSNINEIRNQSFKNRNIQPTKSDFFNTFNYQGDYRPLKGGSYLKIKERYGAELFDQYTGKRIDIASRDFGNNNLKFDPTLEIKNQSNKKPISRQEILQDFLGDIGVPIRSGRIKSKGTQGFYFPPTEQVRTKFPYDLGTAAHEIGHWINGRFPEITKKYFSDPVMKEELKSMGYDYRNPQEGFADFVNFYLNKESIAKEYAPKFYEWFDSTLKNDGFTTLVEGKPKNLKKAMANAQLKFSSYWKQGNINRIKSKMGFVPAIDSTLAPRGDRLQQIYVDNMTGIERFERNLGEINTPIYKKASSLRNGRSILNMAMKKGMVFVKTDQKGNRIVSVDPKQKSLKKIIEPISDRIEDWKIYITSLSAKELKLKGKEKLFTTKEIESGIALAGKDKPRFDKALNEYHTWLDGILNFAERYGELFTREDIKKFKTRAYYVPFNRVDKSMKGNKKFQGGINEFTGIKKLTGGTENLNNIMDNIVGNARFFIENAVENRIKLDVLNFVKESQLKGSERYVIMKPLPPSIGKAKVLTKPIKEKIIENFDLAMDFVEEGRIDFRNFLDGLDVSIEMMGDFANLLTIEKKPKGVDNVMPVMEKGKLKYYEVADPLLFDSLSQLKGGTPLQSTMLNIWRPFKRIGQSAITLTFDFMGANFVRGEIFSGIFNNGYIPFRDGARGFVKRVKEDQNYLDFMANGLDMGSYYRNEGLFLQNMKPFYDKKGINVKKIATSPLKFFRMLEEFGSSIEMAARIQVASNKYKKSKDLIQSVYDGKDNLVDFSKRGSYGTTLSNLLNYANESAMFLRPAVIGLNTVYRGLSGKKPNRKSIATKVALLAGISAMNAIHNSYIPTYNQLEDWDKDTNWHFFIPTKKAIEFYLENGRYPETAAEAYGYDASTANREPLFIHWRLPKIWEIGSIASVSERGAIQIVNPQNSSYETAIQMIQILAGNFRLNPIPQGALPVIEQFTNKSFFTGRPVISKKDEGLPPEMQGFGTTSLTSQKIGEKTGLSPSRIEALWRGYLNTYGMYGLTIADQMFFDTAPDLKLSQYPFFNRFVGKQPAKNTKYTQLAYDMMAEINEVMRAVNESAKQFKPDQAKNYVIENINVLATGADRMRDALSKFNRVIGSIKAANNIETMHLLANGIGSMRGRNKNQYIQNLIDKGIYNDIGQLKNFLMDDIIIQRNDMTEKYVKDIESEKGE